MIRHRPLLGWSAAFVTGITAWSLGLHAMLLLCVLGLIGLGLLTRAMRRWEWTFVAILLTGFAVGALRMGVFQIVAPADVSHWVGGVAPVHVVGVIVSDPEEHLGRTTLRLRALSVSTARQRGTVTGEVYVALTQNAMAGQSLDYGDRVALDGHLETPPGATNPGAFSWRDYLARRAVYCQLRVKRPDAVQRLGGGAIDPYMALAWGVRRRVLSAVDGALPPTEAAVLSGILLGKRTDLPPDLMADFIHTGTVHILATAGLHVGIVAWWLLFCVSG